MSTDAHPRHRPDNSIAVREDAHEDGVAALAAESVALVVGACSTRIGARALNQMAGHDPALLDAAADRCRRASRIDEPVRRVASQLLERAAAELRLARRRPQTGTIRLGGPGGTRP